MRSPKVKTKFRPQKFFLRQTFFFTVCIVYAARFLLLYGSIVLFGKIQTTGCATVSITGVSLNPIAEYMNGIYGLWYHESDDKPVYRCISGSCALERTGFGGWGITQYDGDEYTMYMYKVDGYWHCGPIVGSEDYYYGISNSATYSNLEGKQIS